MSWRGLFVVLCLGGLLLMGLSPLVAQVSTPEVPRSELVADTVVIGEPKWVHGVATNASLEVTIRNTGGAPSSPYTLEYWWERGGQRTWLNGNEEQSIDAGKPLGTNSNNNEWTHDRITWRLQPGQQGNGNILVVIHDGARESEHREPVMVPVHEMAFEAESDDQVIRPSETRFLRAQVRNLGNVAQHDVKVELTDWRIEPSNRRSAVMEEFDVTLEFQGGDAGEGVIDRVPAGGTRDVILYVFYDFSGEEFDFSARFDFTMETPYGHTMNVTTPLLSNQIDAETAPGSPVELRRTDDETLLVEHGAGEPLSLGFRVTNTGSERDAYQIRAIPEAGWTTGLDRDRAALERGASATFQVDVWPSGDALMGDLGGFTLEVQSGRESEPWRWEWPVRVDGPSVRLEAAPGWGGHAYVDDLGRAQVRLINDGTTPTPEGAFIEVTARGEGLGLGSGQSVTEVREAPVVDAGGRRSVDVSVGNYSAGGAVTYEVQWLPPGGLFRAAWMEHEVFVHDPELELSSPSSSLAGRPGEAVGYRTSGNLFTVRNMGNAEETVVTRVQATDGSAALLGASSFTLAPGQTRSVPVEHRLPLPAGTLEHADAVLTVSVMDRPVFQASANVSTRIVDDEPPRIRPVQMPSLWAMDVPLPVSAHVTDDSGVARVEVVHTAPGGGSSVRLLQQEGEDAWSAQILPKEAGNHSFAFQAVDVRGNEAEIDPVHVEVRSIPPPVLTVLGPDNGTVVSAGATFQVHVEDELPLKDVKATLVNEERSFEQVRNLSLRDNVAIFRLDDVPPGNVTITIEAINVAGAHERVTRMVVLDIPEQRAPEVEVDERGLPAPAWTLLLLLVLGGLFTRCRNRRLTVFQSTENREGSP